MYDYLIIGHGLAGALLSHELVKRGRKVLVIGSEKLSSASKVAGGIYNPITGRKLRKTWMADQLFPMLSPYYKALESQLKSKFFYDIGVYRPFFSIEQQNDWNAKSEAEFGHFIHKISNQRHPSLKYKDEYGGVYLKNAGYVNLETLLQNHKNYLTDKGCYQELLFEKDLLKIEKGDKVSYNGMTFDKVVFAMGLGQENFPYFDWLPFRPVKGEVYDFELEANTETIVNRGVFMIPKGDNTYRVGATYDWKNLNETLSKSGKSELTEKLQAVYIGNSKVVKGIAGIRPATKDRRPFIGQHPKHSSLYVFNGFGSKGVSMVPYFAQHFADCLESGRSIEKEVNINRYFSLHYKD